MASEIERKYLVASDDWRTGTTGIGIQQGYLVRDPDRTVRVRISGAEAFFTIKGRSVGISRPEFEYPIPIADARELLTLCLPPLIEKTRYTVVHEGMTWEIDEFHGENQGLIVAEIELPTSETTFPLPAWVGAEVSHLPRYFNSHLSKHPYFRWSLADQSGDLPGSSVGT